MLEADMKAQLGAYLERVQQSFVLSAALDGSAKSNELRELLQEIAALRPDKITVAESDAPDGRRPSFALHKAGEAPRLRFAAIPLGHEFTSLVLALLWAGGHPPKEDADTLAQIKALRPAAPLNFEVYMSLSCHNCPDVVQALSLMALMNEHVNVTVIDGGLFQNEVEQRSIMGVPAVFLNGEMFSSGRTSLADILRKVDTGASAREAEKLANVAPFDVLVVGSGPAGCTAAIYAARKGVRTGLVAERFGGQVNDTMDIANYPGVPEMTGPGYAAQLENHVRQYDVQVMAAQRVAKVTPAEQEGGYISVELENGARLQTRTLIAATGARWRNVNVPGEQEYKTKGVAYCPHCDGPLFKGKDVAVIGGGNSGVEAAIDLAGVVRHVHVLEFLPEMKADAVLQQKLRSLPNVDIHLNVQTTAIDGDGQRVSGLQYKERDSGAEKQIALQGVFVQIGLVPNTEWLDGVVERNRMGEIVVNARCASNVAGIFAAGDCSSVPYKQIVISAGEGAKAALSAFDYLIRTPAPQA